MRQPVLLLGVLDREQRPSVPRREHAGRHAPLHRRRQTQQPQGVGDLRAGAPDALGQLVVRAVEVLEQLVVGRGLFQRVELSAVQVLQQRVQQHLLVVGRPDDRWDLRQARLTAGAPAPLAHDELVALRAHLADHDRLEEADLLDRGHQLGEGVLVELGARLPRVGGDGVQRQLREVRAQAVIHGLQGRGLLDGRVLDFT